MFDEQATLEAIGAIAASINVKPEALQAVAEIESAGKVFAMVRGRREPVIRWEGHYFDRRLTGGLRSKARAAGLASPRAGVVKNPSSQAARWAMVAEAAKIDRAAALESFSIGLGQVMTAHWKKLGFASADEMIKLARRDAAGQVQIMARYIERFGLADELQRLDFTGFARGYNGPNFAAGGYHRKMAAAYERLAGRPAVSKASGMLRMGSTGARVRDLQVLLRRAGYPVNDDGDYGPATRDAVKAFQKARKIAVDGVAGPETARWLEAYRQGPEERPGAKGVTETPEAKEGLGGVAGGVAVETARQTVEQASDKVGGLAGLEWLSVILTVIAVLLVLGGLAWVAWGWWKARHTDEGDVGEVVDLDPVGIEEVLA